MSLAGDIDAVHVLWGGDDFILPVRFWASTRPRAGPRCNRTPLWGPPLHLLGDTVRSLRSPLQVLLGSAALNMP